MADRKIFSVSDLNGKVKALLEGDLTLQNVLVQGELSNYKVYPSGHHYFTMKDAEGALRCVMFKGSASKLVFKPEDGMKVVAGGRVSVFPRDGAYQLYVTALTLHGAGDLHVAFEQLKEKLYGEGLFDQSHKKPIPRYPQRIALITSGAGAAVRDMIRVLGTRYPLAKVIVMPVRVQGAEAPPEIVGALRYANRYQVADLIITGRGGGSIEDLWAFNDERVARAIHASEIPVISAVGHEPDVTIADFVADLRAATPSNAAELAVPHVDEFRESLDSDLSRMALAIRQRLKLYRHRLDQVGQKPVMASPIGYIIQKRRALDHVRERLGGVSGRLFSAKREEYVRLAASLDAMSPLKVLGRGYSVVKRGDGHVLRRAKDVEIGESISVVLREGTLHCTVEERG
ncbi:MAG: exodeoxyribonuclease VII large subunit [Oscillospiraceae bacterium]|nr:exodeoxyribonuclease VII large subunit [Oscillospiraceae bacterium]